MVNDSLRLPTGLRDHAPGAAAARRHLAETLIGVFERAGYAQVITPMFEYEDVLARGLGEAARAAAVRLVEPSSGQVLALRPDITPQVARLCATRFAGEPGPVRLCYEGPVFRHDARTRAQREVIQAGAELCGVPGLAADVEMIALAVDALAAVGVARPTVDLAHLGLVREVLRELALPERSLAHVRERLARRDRAGLAAALTEARGPVEVRAFAARLPALSGPVALVDRALVEAPTARIRAALEHLREVARLLRELKVPADLHVDLNEIRGFDYYTGVRFQAFAHGSAEPLASGGRYDDLVGRYGRARPAVGCAVAVEPVADALEAAGQAPWRRRVQAGGTLVVGERVAAARAATELRRDGGRAAVFPDDLSRADARTYAERWGYDAVAIAHGDAPARALARARVRKLRRRARAAP